VIEAEKASYPIKRLFRKWSAGVGDSTLLMGSCR
jgi:hypothetical protein